MTLRVLDPGLYTLLVDFGRPGSRSLGVPVGGAADRAALALGNALVGNPPDTVALEVSLAGPTLTTDEELACVVYGAPFGLTGSLHPDPRHLRAGKTFTLRAGEEIRVGGTAAGMRAYFCVRGGFAVPATLGSRSGLAPVRVGQELSCRPGTIHGRFLPPAPLGDGDPGVLRVVAGPQADWYEDAAFDAAAFEVTPASNRMGLRLRGTPLTPRQPGRELVSEPVCPGAVQVTNDGQCIVLGVDGQTIGGYPKVAHVVSADLDRLGQLRPGQPVCFARVSLDEAERLYREREAALRQWLDRLLTSSRD